MARIDFRVLFILVVVVALVVSAADNATEASTTSTSSSTSVPTTTTTVTRPGFIQHMVAALTSVPKGMAIACENSAKAMQDFLGSWMPFDGKLS